MAETPLLDPQTVGRHALITETPSTAQTELIPVISQEPEIPLPEPIVRQGKQHTRPTMYFPVATLATLGIIGASSGDNPTVQIEFVPKSAQEAPAPYVANVPVMGNETSRAISHESAPVTGADIAGLHTE